MENKEKNYVAKTKLGEAVLQGKIKNIDEILLKKKPIHEPWIVDILLPNVKYEIMELRTSQRMTDSGRRTYYNAAVIVGSENGYLGVGRGKASEPSIAVNKAIERAKRNIIKVPRGCGSWECQCGTEHSIKRKVSGKESSTYISLKPAPKGLGLAVNDTMKKILYICGIKDVWGKARGATGNIYNTLLATYKALDKLNLYEK